MIFGRNVGYLTKFATKSYATCVRLLLTEHRYFEFHNEVKYFSILTMQQHSGFVIAVNLLLLNFASNYLHDRSLLMSRQ